MISIIILNWNGWKDTIECIKSLYKVSSISFTVIVVDNGSANDSVSQISKFVEENYFHVLYVDEGESLDTPLKDRDLVLYKLSENYGFAKGNNMGLKLLKDQIIDYFWILNNDTVVEHDSVKLLMDFMEQHKDYVACTPQIRYFMPSNRIWNCGGKLFFGFRKYYYNEEENIIFKKDYFDISFVTGCALFIRPQLLDENVNLFTERFFFGEEDFEFSLRMRQQKRKIACCPHSIIYHKVSASTQDRPKLTNIYIYYLNRFINIRQHFSKHEFFLWRLINYFYIPLLLFKIGYKRKVISEFMNVLKTECFMYDGVDKAMFNNRKELSK